jgi:hypothetical protein
VGRAVGMEKPPEGNGIDGKEIDGRPVGRPVGVGRLVGGAGGPLNVGRPVGIGIDGKEIDGRPVGRPVGRVGIGRPVGRPVGS